jgi:hypothetical protein
VNVLPHNLCGDLSRFWRTLVATAREVGGQLVVFEGSTARKKGVSSWQSYKMLREKVLSDGSLAESNYPAYLVFAENVAFNSPSAAASVVMARAANGRAEWVVNGSRISYGHWQDAKLAQVAPGLLNLGEDSQEL